MPVDDILHLEVQGSLNAGLWQQSYYYKVVTDATDPLQNENECAKAWRDTIEPQLLQAVSEEMTSDCGTCQKVFPTPVGNTFIVPFQGNVGSLAGESLPATVAAIITTLTATASRTTRGRKYIPGIREVDQKGGRLLAAELALLDALGGFLIAQITFDAFVAEPVIAHRDPNTPFDVLSSEELTTFTTRPRLGNQRRRRTFRTNIA